MGLLDHLVDTNSNRVGNLDIECPRCLHIHDQLELCRLLDRQITGFRTAQNLIDIISGAPIVFR